MTFIKGLLRRHGDIIQIILYQDVSSFTGLAQQENLANCDASKMSKRPQTSCQPLSNEKQNHYMANP